MTLPTNNSEVSYTGNDVTVAFPFPYLVLDASHLKVYEDGVLQSTGFTLSGIGTASVSANYTVAPTTGTNIKLRRVVPLTQQSDYVENDPLPAETLEGDFDQVVMGLQQLDKEFDRALRAPDGETIGDMVLGNKTSRANKYLQFDSNGLPAFVDVGPSASGTTVTSSPGTVARTLAVRFGDFINVKDWGAAGDGATDDVAAFNAAKSIGAALFIPRGTYKFNSSITLSHILMFEGAVLKPASGTTLTIGEIQCAGDFQIFDLSLGGTVKVTNNRYVHVDWFGAVPDGVTNSLTSINAAAASQDNGGIVQLGIGTYLVAGVVSIKSNTIFQGCGQNATTVKSTSTTLSILNTGATSNVVIRFLTVEGPHPGGVGNNDSGQGIYIHGEVTPCDNIHVYNCTVKNTSNHGLVITTDNNNVQVHNCQFFNNQISIISFKGNTQVKIVDNYILSPRVSGIYSDDATSGDTAITANPPQYILIDGNTIVSPGKDPINTGFGIVVSSTAGAIITNNIIRDSGVFDVQLGGGIVINVGQDDFNPCDNIVIANNVISNCQGFSGIHIEGARNVSVTGNVLSNNNFWGSALGNSAEITISEFSGGGGSVAANIMIDGNVMRRSDANCRSDYGVRLEDANCTDIHFGNNAIFNMVSGDYNSAGDAGDVQWNHVDQGTLPAWAANMQGRLRYNTADNKLYVATNAAWVVVGSQT